MAPPEHPFPVSALDQRVHYHSVELKEKSRKLRGDFDLKRDCELLELVQYSCTTPEQQYQRALASPTGTARMECFPFVRLFRKYGGPSSYSGDFKVHACPFTSKTDAVCYVDVRKRTARCSTSRPPRGRVNMLGSRPEA